MQEDDELAPAKLDANQLIPLDFQVPSPSILSEVERATAIKSAATRIWQSSCDLAIGPHNGGRDMWMLLLVRMITRVVDPEDSRGKARAEGEDEGEGEGNKNSDADVGMDEEMVELYERQDRLRKVLCDYIMADFSGR